MSQKIEQKEQKMQIPLIYINKKNIKKVMDITVNPKKDTIGELIDKIKQKCNSTTRNKIFFDSVDEGILRLYQLRKTENITVHLNLKEVILQFTEIEHKNEEITVIFLNSNNIKIWEEKVDIRPDKLLILLREKIAKITEKETDFEDFTIHFPKLNKEITKTSILMDNDMGIQRLIIVEETKPEYDSENISDSINLMSMNVVSDSSMEADKEADQDVVNVDDIDDIDEIKSSINKKQVVILLLFHLLMSSLKLSFDYIKVTNSLALSIQVISTIIVICIQLLTYKLTLPLSRMIIVVFIIIYLIANIFNYINKYHKHEKQQTPNKIINMSFEILSLLLILVMNIAYPISS